MSETLSKGTLYVRAAEVGDLKDYYGRTFIIRKNSAVKAVKLEKVKGSKAYLEYTEGRVDSFSIPLNEFLKYYELPQKG
ncbi:hypothetical protein ST201phi2-1p288 [Pseudomonas phage 201phi2-1]|uniref:Uncharacterized protein n=1 Tax=Pseudomonas phage 201phi2-1 TaxID=198110 RepID=B3FJE8_BP201|nr:hypothetical protein ST201phi2-1p288 [Pseudomonas phage 201phi2-1]ABY63114.1 hypothetical protein 201phi2-1p288 [Pseudomonas phage 201phi2-1]